jgi:hypothetical protein
VRLRASCRRAHGSPSLNFLVFRRLSQPGFAVACVDPGRSLLVNIVGPDGKPIGGTKATGLSDLHRTAEYEIESSTVEIHGLDSSGPRRVIATFASRKLIGSLYLNGDETGPRTIRLDSWGTITGRIVDGDGKPYGGRGLWSDHDVRTPRPEEYGVLPGGDRGEGIWIAPDGRFHLDGLVPGLKYRASVTDGVINKRCTLFRDVTVVPGEVKDLGALKVVPSVGGRDS